MKFSPSSTRWVSRAAALGAPLVALLLVWMLAIAPYFAMLAEQEAAYDAAAERLARMARIAAGAPALAAALEAAGAAGDADAAYLPGASDPLAAAALQGRIGRLAAAFGVTLATVEPVVDAAASAAAPGRIALAVSASGPLDGVWRLLHALETQRPLLFIDELDLVNPSPASAQWSPGGQPITSLRLRLSGYRRTS